MLSQSCSDAKTADSSFLVLVSEQGGSRPAGESDRLVWRKVEYLLSIDSHFAPFALFLPPLYSRPFFTKQRYRGAARQQQNPIESQQEDERVLYAVRRAISARFRAERSQRVGEDFTGRRIMGGGGGNAAGGEAGFAESLSPSRRGGCSRTGIDRLSSEIDSKAGCSWLFVIGFQSSGRGSARGADTEAWAEARSKQALMVSVIVRSNILVCSAKAISIAVLIVFSRKSLSPFNCSWLKSDICHSVGMLKESQDILVDLAKGYREYRCWRL